MSELLLLRNKSVSIFGHDSLWSQRDQIFIDRDDTDRLPSSVGVNHLVAEKLISLPWSEAILFSNVSINISPLCGERRICEITFHS